MQKALTFYKHMPRNTAVIKLISCYCNTRNDNRKSLEMHVSYYHIVIEVNDHISTIEQTRDIEIFDIIEIQPYLHSILLPYFNEQLIELEDENIEFKDILHLQVKQTLLPIQDLIEEEQRLLPSDTDITISAYEIFNNRDLSQDVTTVIFDILEAAKLQA
jgi:hypothetical protein